MTTTGKKTCYDPKTLQRLLEEQLRSDEVEAVEQHIEECEACRNQLAKLAGDHDLASEIREHFVDHSLATQDLSESVDDQVEPIDVGQLKALLGPTDDPKMLGRMGHYEVIGVVGLGSTGVVFKALDTRLNRYVAIKILAPSFAGSVAARKRFEREARSIAAVRDEHVIPVFAVDEHQGQPFIVMDYKPAGSLAQRIADQGSLDNVEVVRVGMQVAKALAAAHQQGIVHRDVKPANVLLENGVERAIVTDFGLARILNEASMTRSGAISGTPQYMSPEQAMGEVTDHRSDLFSLGSVMYTACTGRPPFRSETLFGVIKRVCESDPRPIRDTHPEIKQWLCDFIEKLHAKGPDDRFDSAEQVSELLAEELAFLQSPTSVSKPSRSWRAAKSNPLTSKLGKRAIAIGVSVLLGGSLLFAGMQTLGPDQARLKLGGSQEKNSTDSKDSKAGTGRVAKSASKGSGNGRISANASTGSNQVFLIQNAEEECDDLDHFDRGFEAHQEGDYEVAIELFLKAVEEESHGGLAEFNIGCAYALLDQPDQAFPWLNKAIDAGFSDVEHISQDSDLDSLRDDRRFKTFLEKAKRENRLGEMISEAISLRSRERYQEANQILQSILVDHPDNENAIVEYGLSLHLEGRLEEALKWHRKAAKTDGFKHYGNYNIACYHSLKEQPDQAFVYFEKAVDAGMLDIRHFEVDSDLDNIRDDPRYEELLDEVESELRKSWKKSERDSYELIQAIRSRDYDRQIELLEYVSPENTVPEYRGQTMWMEPRRSPLGTAAELGDLEAIELLVSAEVDLNPKGFGHQSPAMKAAANGHQEVVTYFLDQGVQINDSFPGRGTILSAAAAADEIEMMKMLLKQGADIDIRTDGLGTALHVACRLGSIESVRFLIDQGANVNAKQPGVGSPLSVAAQREKLDIMQELISSDAKLDNQVSGVGTPLTAAVRFGKRRSAKFLLHSGAEANSAGPGVGTPLSTAAGNGDIEMIKILQSHEADLDQCASGVGSALCAAARNRQAEAVEYLLEAGADPNQTSPGVMTPLAYGVKIESVPIVTMLLKFGADAELKPSGQRSALDYAKRTDNEAILKLVSEEKRR